MMGSDGGKRVVSSVATALADGGFDAPFFHKVVERVGVGVGVYDDTGRYTYVNEAYADLLGRDIADVVGMRVWHVNPELDGGRFEEYWESFELGETREHQGRHRTGDGKVVHVETVTTAIMVEGKRYHVGTIADISARVEEMRAAKRQDERLEEFASVVSHDLRNPLNVAMGRVELVEADCDSEHLDHVERSLVRMEALIDDVLTLAREGSRLTEPEVVDVEEAVRTAWYTSGGGDADIEIVDDLGSVKSEESRLCQIFENLFSNAVEHGSTSPDSQARQDAGRASSSEPSVADAPEDAVEHGSTSPPSQAQEDAIQHGGPNVTVTVGRHDDGFYVEDDGPGVPEDEREEVFEYGYSQSDDGTGFGLTIVKRVSEAHDWSVALAESESGGARFEFHGVEFLDR